MAAAALMQGRAAHEKVRLRAAQMSELEIRPSAVKG
jgi:hypothetical protein